MAGGQGIILTKPEVPAGECVLLGDLVARVTGQSWIAEWLDPPPSPDQMLHGVKYEDVK